MPQKEEILHPAYDAGYSAGYYDEPEEDVIKPWRGKWNRKWFRLGYMDGEEDRLNNRPYGWT